VYAQASQEAAPSWPNRVSQHVRSPDASRGWTWVIVPSPGCSNESTSPKYQDVSTRHHTHIYIHTYIYMDLYEYISIYVYIHVHVHFVRSKGWDRYMYIKYIFGSILYHLFRIGAGSSRFCGWTAWLCDPWILSVSTWYYIWAPLPMRLSSCSHFKWQTSHCWLIIDQHKD